MKDVYLSSILSFSSGFGAFTLKQLRLNETGNVVPKQNEELKEAEKHQSCREEHELPPSVQRQRIYTAGPAGGVRTNSNEAMALRMEHKMLLSKAQT